MNSRQTALLRGFGVIQKGLGTLFLSLYKYRYSFLFVGWTGATYTVGSAYLYELRHADGNSMYPTIPDQENQIFVNKLYRRGRGVQVGDVVTFASPMFPGMTANKRIIGMPGDIVMRSSDRHPTPGDLPLCGITDWRKRLSAQKAINEFGAMDKMGDAGEEDETPEPQMIQIPEGHVWLEGDNLAHSRDSRFYGPIPMALIGGRTEYFRTSSWQFWPNSLHAGQGFRKVPDNEVEYALLPYDDD